MKLQDASNQEMKPLIRPFRTLYFLDNRAEYLPKHYATELSTLFFPMASIEEIPVSQN
jgi:hypothetical protein